MLCLYKASYSVYGSYMDSTTPSNILTIVFVALHLLTLFCFSLLTYAVLGIIALRAKTNAKKLMFLYSGDERSVPYLTTMLQGIGYLGK